MTEISRKRTHDGNIVSELQEQISEIKRLIKQSEDRTADLCEKLRDVEQKLSEAELEQIREFVIENRVTIAKENLTDLPDDVEKHKVTLKVEWGGDHKTNQAGFLHSICALMDEFTIAEIVVDKTTEKEIPNIRAEIEDFVSTPSYRESFLEDDVTRGSYKYEDLGHGQGRWVGEEKVYVYIGRGKDTKKICHKSYVNDDGEGGTSVKN